MNLIFRKRFVSLISVLSFFAASPAWGEELVASWNFNYDSDDGTAATSITPVGRLLEVDDGAGVLTTNWTASDLLNRAGTTLNAVTGEDAGRALAFAAGDDGDGNHRNEGNYVQFEISMSGKSSLELSYALFQTTFGYRQHDWSWSLTDVDQDFVVFLSRTNDQLSEWEEVSHSLAGIADINDAETVYIRNIFSTMDGQSTPGGAGNSRFDNIQFNAIPEPSTYAAVFGGLALIFVCLLRRRARRWTV